MGWDPSVTGLGNVFSVVAPIAPSCLYPGRRVTGRVSHHPRGRSRGMQFAVRCFDRRTPHCPARLLRFLLPLSHLKPPLPLPPFPTHTLNIRSLVRSQIIELLLPHDLQHQNILPDRSTSALRPRKPRTQRRPDETCEEASKQVRDQLFFLFALTKRADDLRVCLPFSPTTQEPPPSTSRPSRHR